MSTEVVTKSWVLEVDFDEADRRSFIEERTLLGDCQFVDADGDLIITKATDAAVHLRMRFYDKILSIRHMTAPF